jgi:uncharacterized membrane protein HdeD (DUF308 family)
MENVLNRNWWAVLVRGLLAIGFAILAWARPGITLGVLIILFGIYAIDDGIFALASARRAAHVERPAWPFVVEGIFGIAVGVWTFLAPAKMAVMVFLAIAIWAIATGVLELFEAIRVRRGGGLLALSGALRILFGVLILRRPTAGVDAFVWLIGAYGFAYGVVMVLLSLRMRSARPVEPMGMTPQPV